MVKLQQVGGEVGLTLGNLLGGWDSKALDPHCTLSKCDLVPPVTNRAFSALCYMASKGYFRLYFGLF